MSWETMQIKDVCKKVTSGGTPLTSKENYYFPRQIPWIKTKEVNYCRITDAETYISQEGLDNSSAKLIPANSVIVAMYGQGDTAGRVAINKIPVATNQACCNLIIDETKADYRFVYYKLSTLYEKLVSLKNGGAQPNLNAAIIKGLEIEVPTLEVQHSIADVLSTYDDLIENNQKQIKLLEEAAQRLYKEWFVDLRFPGHETTSIIDGIPQGWKQESIDNVYSIKYGKNLPTTEISTNGKYPVYGANGVIGYYDKYNCDAYVTLITSRGNGSGDVSRTHHSNSFVTNNSFVVIPQQAYDFISNEFTYWLMKHTDFKSICTGSAQPQLTNNSISTLKVLVPTKKLILYFCEITRTYFENIERLLKQNRLLTEARDRLLPKLMRGELEV